MGAFIKENKMMEKLRRHEVAFGFQCRSRSVLMAELAGYIGFDYIYLDTEHYACNDETVEAIMRCAQLTGSTGIVRIMQPDPEMVMHMLDVGAKGVILSHMEDPEDARAFVEGGKYPPLGHRGASACSRAAALGTLPDSKKYFEDANKNTVMIGMVETVKGVRNIEGILDAGVDIIRIGRGDLSLDMGLHEQQERPEFIDAMKQVITACEKRGVPVGTSCKDVETAKYYVNMGFTMLTLVADLDYFARKLPGELQAVRDAVR